MVAFNEMKARCICVCFSDPPMEFRCTTSLCICRLVQKTAVSDHRREELATEQASLESLQAQAAEVASNGKGEALAAATVSRDEAAAAHEACALPPYHRSSAADTNGCASEIA